uniref:Decapping nuclease n=1 Tax=Ditylenchus dipsaci TaxID=166011 RepID=A0A915EA90_9BILA
MAGLESRNSTLILVIWRHLLNLSELRKPEGARLVVVGPSNLVVDEKQIDVIHHVEGLSLQRPKPHSADAKKGPLPEQFDQLMRRKDIRAVCRRGGLTTLRCCSFGSVQGKPEAWVECANSQVGQYPMFLRPVNAEVNCMHTLCIAHNAEDLKSWIRARPQSSNYCVDYLVEECLENGYEFIAIVSSKTGLIGAFSTIDKKRTFYMSVKSQAAYGIEYFNADQTRDILPGVESFVMQSMKTVFNRSINSLVFVKGFYRGHNTITFMGGSLELRKGSLATLFREANNNKTWEVFAVETQFGSEVQKTSTSSSNGHLQQISFRTNTMLSSIFLIPKVFCCIKPK